MGDIRHIASHDKSRNVQIAGCFNQVRVALLTLLVLDLALDVVDCVRALHLKGDGLASQSLDKDLHATTQTQHQMEGGLLLDVVVCQGAAILKLLASKDQALLVRWDACMMAIQNNHMMHVPERLLQVRLTESSELVQIALSKTME